MPSLGLENSCCQAPPMAPWRDRVPFGASLASYSALLGSAGFISMLLVSNPDLRPHLGCLRTCWIELSLQRELDFALLQELCGSPQRQQEREGRGSQAFIVVVVQGACFQEIPTRIPQNPVQVPVVSLRSAWEVSGAPGGPLHLPGEVAGPL